MNALPAEAAARDWTEPTVDATNPWLGLASFTEETRGYFFGREEEVAELARRVQRKLLTVLFGQSGLGKTSVLRAGLVPRLRDQGYCPVYVRIAYGADTPEPAEQIKEAIRRSARRSGEWTQAGVAVEGESLWEYLHHRDDVLRDESGGTLIPLLIFDQFEEIFTLAQGDEAGRARAARFIDELADLVENRPPKSLESALDNDDSAAERFDFARSDYRVLIALREDYLAPLESLKRMMPSLAQNRLRLAPMTGLQALAAVTRPGGKLVSEEVAAAIVRFVAGGAELANAEVEPSLLSLICRELNDARIAQGRAEISLDLLAGSHASILSNFYERALADQPAGVRRIVEDDLLTASGFRENVAEENLIRRFSAAGATANTLATLVNRRLLRIEERLDVRRVELTHDVLTSVVKHSRDQRQERESREATERLLSEQQTRELAARRALLKARQIAAVCTILAIGAIAAAVVAYFSSQRARRAERQAQETRAVAEQARGGAEHLLGYLNDDFVRELESFGRLNVLAEFSQRQIDYFHGLPAALKGPETTRNGALAMVHHADALRYFGELDTGAQNAAEAIQLLERQRAQGDDSEASLIALALAYLTKAKIQDNSNDPAATPTVMHAAELLRPVAESANASIAARRAYAEILVRVGFEQEAHGNFKDGILSEHQARMLAEALGAKNPEHLDMGALYAEAGAWEVNGLASVGRRDEARRVGADAVATAEKVLEMRPGYRLALHAEQVVIGGLGNAAGDDLNPLEGLRYAHKGEQVSATLLNLDPNNVTSINNLAVSHSNIADSLWYAGQLREAIPYYVQALKDFGQATHGGSVFALTRTYAMAGTAYRQAQTGDFAGARGTIAAGEPFLEQLRGSEPGSFTLALIEPFTQLAVAGVAFERADFVAVSRALPSIRDRLRSAKPTSGDTPVEQHGARYFAAHLAGRVAYMQGDFAAAGIAESEALQERTANSNGSTQDSRELSEVSTWLAMAQARQNKLQEAAATITPVVKTQRELSARNHGDGWLPFELACALYAQALAQPAQRAALLREAGGLLDHLMPSIRDLSDVRWWRKRVREAASGTIAPAQGATQ